MPVAVRWGHKLTSYASDSMFLKIVLLNSLLQAMPSSPTFFKGTTKSVRACRWVYMQLTFRAGQRRCSVKFRTRRAVQYSSTKPLGPRRLPFHHYHQRQGRCNATRLSCPMVHDHVARPSHYACLFSLPWLPVRCFRCEADYFSSAAECYPQV